MCHRASVNLDSFMASESHLKELLESHANGTDVCVAEGMMGLFDGYQKSRGSAAEIAASSLIGNNVDIDRLLNIQVLSDKSPANILVFSDKTREEICVKLTKH